MDTIAARIDFAMQQAGIKSQADLARLSGVPNSTVVRILKENSLPNVPNLAAISRACGVSMDWLATGESADTHPPVVSLTYVTSREMDILTTFRKCTPETQQKIILTIETLAIRSGSGILDQP